MFPEDDKMATLTSRQPMETLVGWGQGGGGTLTDRKRLLDIKMQEASKSAQTKKVVKV